MPSIAPPGTQSAYEAALLSSVYYPRPSPGTVLVAGETRRDYLQRQTTNDLDLLDPQHALPSLLTSASGRVLEAFTLLGDGDRILMLTQPGHGPGVAEYFRKKVFFNDKASIQDHSSSWAQIELHGPQATRQLNTLGVAEPPHLNEVETAEIGTYPFRVLGQPGLVGLSSYLLLFPYSELDHFAKLLEARGITLLDAASLSALRIEASLAGDPEFTHRYTPFELGLDALVSSEKGCYTGQEVLARQVTYDKVVRRLVRLSTSQLLVAGSVLQSQGKHAGEVTSTAISPRLGPIALSVLRKPYDQAGTSLDAFVGDQAISAIVI